MAKTLPYRAGDFIAVPLRMTEGPVRPEDSWAVGFTRSHDGDGMCAGHFFGAVYETVPDLDDVAGLGPADVVTSAIFGDLGLLQGGWVVIGQHADAVVQDWPVLEFCYSSKLQNLYQRVVYSPDSLRRNPLSVSQVTPEECAELPSSALRGYLSLQRWLTKRLIGESKAEE